MGMVACPELTASSCPALGVRCERFEVISAVGQCGLGAGAVGQLSRSVISNCMRGPWVLPPHRPLWDLESLVLMGPWQAAGGDGQHQTQSSPCPSI